MNSNNVYSDYNTQKPVFDREIKAPKLRQRNIHIECNDRFEKNKETDIELHKAIGKELSKGFSKIVLPIMGIAGVLALIPEIISKFKK